MDPFTAGADAHELQNGGQTFEGSFSVVSKQARKQAGTFGPSQKRREAEVSARNQNTPDLIPPVH